MKRDHITRYEKNRALFLKVGLIISLSLTILAFRWTIPVDQMPQEVVPLAEEDNSIEVIRTVHPKKRVPPPPVVQPSEMVLPELEIEFTEIPETPTSDSAVLDVGPIEDPVNETSFPPTPQKSPVIEEVEEEIPEFFKIVEQMPVFGQNCLDASLSKTEVKQCSDRAIMKYFADNIRYPSMARENHIEGMVVIQFIINESGKVTKTKIVREIGGGCGAEAVRVANSMPEWQPGSQRNREVKVMMSLPIRFRLQN